MNIIRAAGQIFAISAIIMSIMLPAWAEEPSSETGTTGLPAETVVTNVAPEMISDGESKASARAWSIEPSLSGGIVYEFTDNISYYKGLGIEAEYMPGRWIFYGSYDFKDYVMSYFGVTWEAMSQLLQQGSFTGQFLSRVDVQEKRGDAELLIGRRFVSRGFTLFAGARRVNLKNDFSSFESAGPALRLEGDLKWRQRQVRYEIEGMFVASEDVRNHRADFVLFDGYSTLSYYGAPEYFLGWGLGIGSSGDPRKGIYAGYEGSMIGLEYGYRYYHGLSLRIAF